MLLIPIFLLFSIAPLTRSAGNLRLSIGPRSLSAHAGPYVTNHLGLDTLTNQRRSEVKSSNETIAQDWITGTRSFLSQIGQSITASFLIGVVLGVFLKLIIESTFKGFARLVRNRLQRTVLSVVRDYVCKLEHNGTLRPLEPHLTVTNKTNDRLSISKVDIQYGERRRHKILGTIYLETYRVLYSSPLISEEVGLEPKGELKIFLRPAEEGALEIVETKPSMRLKEVRVNQMPAEVMRYVALTGKRIEGKSEWIDQDSIGPSIR